MNQSFFSWSGDPSIFRIDAINLPFGFSILGILAAIGIYFLGYNYLKQRLNPTVTDKKKRRKTETPKETPVPGLHLFALATGAFFLGQLVFAGLSIGPVFEHLGPITLRWYGFLFALSFILGYIIGSQMFKHGGYPQSYADSLLTYLFIATIVGARLGEVIFYNAEYYIRNPLEILYIWQGGLASHGAFIGVILAIWVYVKRRPDVTYIWVLDRMTIPFAIGGIFVRLGNFFNSEIYGQPTDVSWAVIFERIDMLPRHPSMLYEAGVALLLLIVLAFVYKKYNNHPPNGALTGLFMTILFTGRFFVEITKVEQADFATEWLVGMGQILSIPIVLIGLYILIAKVNWKSNSNPQTE